MTVDDFILKMADGIRAGTIKFHGGEASIEDMGQTEIEVMTLTEKPRFAPIMFTLRLDATYVQVE